MESSSFADEAPWRRTVRELRELVAALDRRVPHVERAGEADIARSAAALRAAAVQRIEEVQRAGVRGPGIAPALPDPATDAQ